LLPNEEARADDALAAALVLDVRAPPLGAALGTCMVTVDDDELELDAAPPPVLAMAFLSALSSSSNMIAS
jgi:hypothetical protein